MKTKSLVGLAAGFTLVARIPSVNPWYTDDDIRFAPELVGAWQQGSGSNTETWTFASRENDSGYRLTVESDGEQGEFKATLFTLGEHRFLDLLAGDVNFADGQLPLVELSLFPGHLVMHVAAIEPELKLAFIDVDWLEDHLEQNPAALSHRIEDDRALLTGSTSELQQFLRRHVDGGLLFTDYSAMHR